jgi:hypothetical protein
MPNEVHIEVTADTSGIKETNAEIDKLKAKAKETIPVVDGLSDKMTESDKAALGAGKSLNETERRLTSLNASITGSQGKLKELAAAFADANDSAKKIDIEKSMRKVQHDLDLATKAKKILVGFEPDPKDTRGFADTMRELGAKGGIVTGIGILAGVVAIGPTLASALAGAVTGGVGAGGIVGGVALASKDPLVAKAAENLSTSFQSVIGKSATKWFQKPLLDSVPMIKGQLQTLEGSIEGTFKNLAPFLRPLIEDVLVAVNRIGGAFEKVSANAGPALIGIGASVKLLADGIGDFLEEISQNGTDAAGSLTLIAGAMADILRFTGKVINALSELANSPWSGMIPTLIKHYMGAADASNNFSDATGTVAREMSNAEHAARGEQDALAQLSQELKGQVDPVFAMFKAQKDLTAAQKDAKKAMHDHGKSSDEYKEAMDKAVLASLDLEGAVGTLGDKFDGKLTPSLISTLEAAGVTKPMIDELGKQFAASRKKGDDFAKTYAARAVVNGVPTARHNIQTLKQELASMKTNWNITVRTSFLTFGKPYSQAGINSGNVGGLASGGIKGAASGMSPNGLTWVGENGPELADLGAGSRVWSAGDSARMASRGGDGAQQIVVNLVVDGQTLASTMVEPLREKVRTLGSGSAQTYWGQPGRG